VACCIAGAIFAYALLLPIVGTICLGTAMLAVLACQIWTYSALRGREHRPIAIGDVARVVDALPTPAYAFDIPSTTILAVNDALCQLLGYEAATLIDRSGLDLAPDWVHARARQALATLLVEGRITAREVPWHKADGSLVWLDIEARLVENAEQRHGIFVLHDITERRTMEEELARHSDELRRANRELQDNIARLAGSEARHRALFTQAMDAVLLVGADNSVIRDANPQAAALWHRTVSSLAGTPVTTLDLAGSGRFSEVVRRAADDGAAMLHEVPLLLEGDQLLHVDVSASRVSVDTQRLIQLVVRDVSDRHRLRQQIEETNRELERQSLELQRVNAELGKANVVKSQFLANMSHEVRTPLNAIKGFAELLADPSFGTLNEQQRGFVDRISDAGQHLLQLINDVLDLAKVEAGTVALDRQLVRLDLAAEQVIKIIKGTARTRGMSIELEVAAEEPLVFADERRVKQVMFNLLSNAIRYSPEGSTINVKVELDGEIARLNVSDHGVGVPAHEQEHIFEEFVQLGDNKQRTGGAGLGLPLSRKLVRLHGGDIGVRSTPGQGSTFWFTLPVGHIPDDAPPETIGDVKPESYRHNAGK
jgi:PAS domain S-box-containing protein